LIKTIDLSYGPQTDKPNNNYKDIHLACSLVECKHPDYD